MIDLNDIVKIDTRKAELLKPYSIFFKRVLDVSALRINEICQFLMIEDGIAEMIWSVF